MNDFEKYSMQLFEVISGRTNSKGFRDLVSEAVPSPRYLIKGDVSGIQSFIFTIPSKGASRELKARSEFIKEYTNKWLEEIISGSTGNKILSCGGGNFYMFAGFNDSSFLESIERRISAESPEGLYLALSWVKADDLDSITVTRTQLEKESTIKKLKKYHSLPSMFEPTPATEPEFFHRKAGRQYSGLAKWNDDLLRAIENCDSDIESVNEHEDQPFVGNVVSFRHLAILAGIRTGTFKIAVLKMDVDNLGSFFSKLGEAGEINKASESLDFFFSVYLYDMLNKSMVSRSKKTDLPESLFIFRNNMHLVFSGGDDCFIIGAWDAVMEFTVAVRKEFDLFIRKDKTDSSNEITLSASVQLYSPSYPVYKFADEAEENLHLAKQLYEGRKNSLFFFGEVFQWTEFEQVLRVKNLLYELIAVRKESRAILERIRQSGELYERDRQNCLEGNELPKTWRLNYSIGRNIRNHENRIFAEKNILSEYESNLLRAYHEKIQISAMVFPVAARYTELLTRN